MKRVLLPLLTILLSLAPASPTARAADAPSAPPRRLLWLGTGFSTYNKLGTTVDQWLTTRGGLPSESICSYVWPYNNLLLENPKSLNLPNDKTIDGLFRRIATDNSTDVIIQILSGYYDDEFYQTKAQGLTPGGERTDAVTDDLVRRARAAGKRPWIYAGGRPLERSKKSGDTPVFSEEYPARYARILAAAKRNNVQVIPVSRAIELFFRKYPQHASLPFPDDGHPGPLEAYVIPCVFYAAFTDKPPAKAGLPLEYLVAQQVESPNAKGGGKRLVPAPTTLTPEVAAAIQECAWEAWLEVRPAKSASAAK